MTQNFYDNDFENQRPKEFPSVIFWLMAWVWGFTAVGSSPFLFMPALMLLDDPGSKHTLFDQFFALTLLAIPAAAFIAPFAAYPFKKKGETKKVMAIFFGLPAIPVCVFVLTLVVNS